MNQRSSTRKRNAARLSRKPSSRRHLVLEGLEDRRLLTTYTVINTADTGPGSLRDAVAQANANVGADDIVFSSLFNTPQTITLTSGQLSLTDASTTTITGPGASLLTVSGNNASGVFSVGTGDFASLSGLTVTGGSAVTGGGVNNLGNTTLTNCTFTGNTASTNGGGVFSSGTVTLTGCTFTSNTATTNGGGAFSSGTATLTDCTLSGNTATGNKGGGVYAPSGTISLNGVTLSSNHAGYRGGGFGNQNASATLTGCTISGNSVDNGSASGGGGVFNRNTTTTLTNCTIVGNTSAGGFEAAGVFNVAGSVSLANCTVTGNIGQSPTLGFGVFNQSATAISFRNTIVAGNTGSDVAGVVSSGGGNLIGNIATTTGWLGSDLTGTSTAPLNPRLGALADNGGPTQTMALLPNSPAINAGNPALAPATDQRGLARFGNTDIGAFEYQFKVTSTADSGNGSLRQAVANANSTAGADTVIFTSLFNTPQTITLTSGQIAFTDASTTTITGTGAGLLTVSGNNASRVFDVASGASAAISGLTITGGTTSSFGGGGLANSGTVTLSNATVSGNTAVNGFWGGGGVFNYSTGTATLTNVTVSGNSTPTNAIKGGGGLFNMGTMTVTNSAITGNTSSGEKGGIGNHYAGNLTLSDVTVSGNTGGGVGSDGGNSDGVGMTVTMTNVTISNNTGAGLSGVRGGTTTLANTIVAGNSTDLSFSLVATLTSSGNNLIGNNGGMTGWLASDQTGTAASPLNARLGALANNGGPTQTMALLPYSPAIGAGNPANAPATDQRGQTRFGSTDIGAYEYQLKVTNTTDAGLGSLRQAITLANSSAGADTVVFRIGTGAKTISPASALPTITQPIVIDGTTQPGFAGTPLIQIDGLSAGGGVNGLTTTAGAGGSTIEGLIISDFASNGGNGIVLNGNNYIIQGNWIGLDATGTAAAPNFHGIVISGFGDLIGTNGDGVNDSGERNVISGNNDAGVYSSGSGNTRIAGNYIGTNAAGDAPLQNSSANVFFAFSDGTIIGVGDASNNPYAADERNVIAGGIQVSRSTVIAGNYIGLNAAGTAALSAANNTGISFGNAMPGARIGTNADGINDAAERNVISGLHGTGIAVGTAGNLVIAGNYIGTNAAGTAAIPNLQGIQLLTSSTGVLIGSNANGVNDAVKGNLISGNTVVGVQISNTSSGNIVAGNTIGLNAAATAALANGIGVQIDTGSSNNTIGGTGVGAGNVITGNLGAGIVVQSSPSAVIQGNVITANGGPGVSLNYVAAGSATIGRNSIAGNGGLGVAINFAGNTSGYSTANNATVAAPNVGAALDAPVITSASIRSGLLTVTGFSRPGAIIEFDAAPTVGGANQGTGYLGTFTEGSAADSDTGSGSYSNAAGSDPNAAKFKFTFAIPTTYTAGTVITALSQGTAAHPSASEYGVDATSDAGGGLVGPILSAGVNQTILAGQMFSYHGTFGDNTSAVISASVDYAFGGANGSGAGDPGFQSLKIDPVAPISATSDQYTPTTNGGFTLSQLYKTPGVYTVVVHLSDGPLSSSTTMTVTVLPAPAAIDNSGITLSPAGTTTNATPAVVTVGHGVTLAGRFTDVDPAPGVLPTVEAVWGDGSVTFPVAVQDPSQPSSYTFTGTHVYVAPSSGTQAGGAYPVAVIITQTVNGQVLTSRTTEGLFYAEVLDTPPTGLSLTTHASSVTAGSPVSLSGTFVAPTDPSDVYDVTVDWGDGSSPTTYTTAGGVTSFSLSHAYSADQIGASEFIRASVADRYEPLAATTASTAVSVVAPAGSVLSIATDASRIVQGNAIHLTGTLSAAFPGDAQDVTIRWGDGTSQDVRLAAGVSTLPSIRHVYPIHPVGAPSGSYTITASAADIVRPNVAAATASTSVEVDDMPPGVSNLSLKDIRGNVLSQVPEKSTVVLTGTYTNPGGINSADAITVDWGDGSLPTPAAVNALTHTFTAQHAYGTIRPGSGGTLPLTSSLLITATATELGTTPAVSGSASIALGLNHVGPKVAVLSGGVSNGVPILTVPNAGDTGAVTYSWTVNGSPVAATTSYSPTFTPGANTYQAVTVTATDSYGATTSATTTVALLDDASPLVVLPPALGGSTSILAIDLNAAGNRTIAAGNVVIANGAPVMAGLMPTRTATPDFTPIAFDAVGTNETFIGNQGNDTFNLHADGVKAYGMGGNNVFAITPNCTIEAFATSGQNTLDFSSSSFGVTFDLNQTHGTFQNVQPSQPSADHIVMVNDGGVAGTFSTLVCSAGGQDVITAASNTTINGSGNMVADPANMSMADTVYLASSSNVTVNAGGTGQVIQNAAGATASGITVNGDASTSAVASKAGIRFVNQGAVSGVSFFGDAGSTTFQNNPGATTGGTISFNGDTGSTTYANGAMPGQTISFTGDTGSGTFANGTVASDATISFNGDTGSDTFLNNPGATASGTISFTGDTGSATFVDGSPAGTGSTISFGGDTGSTTFGNGSTTTTGTVSFSGDSGSATFINSPGSIAGGTISFTGDTGSTTFVDGASAGGPPISYSGDTSSTTFSNGEVAPSGTVSFTGDTGSATFQNNPGATMGGTVSFTGDTGSQTFENGTPAGTGTVSFNGDTGSTTFGNGSTTTTGTVSFSGDSGSQTFVDNPGATAGGTISFTGDTGSQTFVNDTGATAGGTITFNGDTGSTTFQNGSSGGVGGTISFTGDTGSTTLTNGDVAAGATISFNGDGGSTTFINDPNATVAGSVSFSGDTGSTTFVNGAAAGTTVSYSGDTGSTTFNNGTVAPGGTVSFTGDTGSSTFVNDPGATASGSVSFSGDTGSTTFVNGAVPGSGTTVSYSGDTGSGTFSDTGTTTTGTVSFNGDTGSAIFLNSPGAGTGGTVSFTGDTGSQTFDNLGVVGSGGTSTTVSFSGDQGQATFVNGAILGVFPNFSFSDTGSGTYGNGTVAAGVTISFHGDTGSSVFLNGAPSGSSTSFTGDTGSTVFVNGTLAAGSTVSFTGDTGSSVFVNDPGATAGGTISFSGDTGSTTFVNGAGGGTTVSYSGDTGSETFDNGTIAAGSTISFNGDTGSTTFDNNPGATQGGTVSFTGDTGSSTFQNGSPSGSGATVSFTGDSSSTTFQNADTVLTGTVSFNGDTGSSTFQNNPGSAAPSGSVSFSGDGGADIVLNAGLIVGNLTMGSHVGGNRFLNGEVLANGVVSGRVAGGVTLNATGGAETFANYGTIDGPVVVNGGSATNSAYNAGAAGSIRFVGNPVTTAAPTLSVSGQLIPSNQVDNEWAGLSSISYVGGAGGNLLINRGAGVGAITFQAFGDVNYLENFGDGVGSLSMTAGIGQADLLTNAGNRLGQIRFVGGGDGGALFNAGSDIPSIVDTAGAGSQIFSNSGSGDGITFVGSNGSDQFYDGGSIIDALTGVVGSLKYTGGSGSDALSFAGDLSEPGQGVSARVDGGSGAMTVSVGRGATVSGLVLVDATGQLLVADYGTLLGSTIDARGSAASGLLIGVGGTIGGGSVYDSASAAGILLNQNAGAASTIALNLLSFGAINGLDYYGSGTGLVGLYDPTDLDPADTLHVSATHAFTYHAGSSGDTLVIGPKARGVSGITLDGGTGASELDLYAAGASNITVNGGAGAITVRNSGDGASGLTLNTGSGGGELINSGDGVSGLLVRAASTGDATLYNAGNQFGTLQVIGGPGTNTLTNTGLGNSGSMLQLIAGSGKNDLASNGNGVGSIFLTDPSGVNGDDLLINDGDGVGRILMSTNGGFSTLFNTGSGIGSIEDDAHGGSPTVVNTGAVASLLFNGGTGTATLMDSGDNGPNASIVFRGGGLNDVFQDTATAGSVLFDAAGGSGQVILGFGSSGVPGATGAITLIEGSGGGNTYTFVGKPTPGANGVPQATVVITPPVVTGTGTNSLDFSSYSGGGLTLDLMETTPQAIAGGLSLTLTNPNEITRVVGTQFTNAIYGNTLADTLASAAFPDATTASSYHTPAVPNAATQWALLDFTSYADPVTSTDPNGPSSTHAYTAAEQAQILATLQADYWGPGGAANPWFNVAFATSVAQIPAGVDYATLYFNRTPSTGQPGGQSSEVDFGNLDRGGYASIQVNGLLGGSDEPPVIAADGTDNFAVLSAKIAAHEFAHLLGVRHSDAFGPIGYGIHTPPGSVDFNPAYGGPDAAFETFDHIISSPATQGSDRFNDLRPLDFGPRESIKIAFGEQGTITPETGGNVPGATPHTTMADAMPFPLAPLSVPNTDITLPGVEQGMSLQVVAGAVSGSIGLGSDGRAAPAYFSFSGKKGQVFTFETESQQLPALAGGGSVDTRIEILDANGNPVPYNGGIALNDDQFEGTDSLLDDVVLPADGVYYVKVTSFAAQAGDPAYDPANPASPLSIANTASILNPANPNYNPAARAAYIAAGNGTATGRFDLFIYRESQADPTALNVNNTLVARGAGSILASSGQGDTLIATGGNNQFLIGGNLVTLSPSTTAPTVDLLSPPLFNVTIAGAVATSVPYTIDYGDHTSATSGSAQVGQPLASTHLYATPGQYSVTVSYTLGGDHLQLAVPVTILELQAPVASVTAVPTTVVNGSTAQFGASLQNPYPGTTYTATWTLSSPSLATPIVVSQTVTPIPGATSLPITLSQVPTIDGAYTVQLVVTNQTTGLSSQATFAAGVSSTVDVVNPATSVSFTPPSSSIVYTGTAFAPPAATVDDASGNAVAGASVTYSYAQMVNGVATGLSAPPVDVGSYVLTVSYAGDATHQGSSASAAFSITPAAPALSVTTTNAAYSGSPYPGSPVTTVNGAITTSGIAYTYTAQGSTTPIAVPTHAGSYTVTAHYAGSLDYTAGTASANFTILAASTSVTGSLSGNAFGSTTLTATVTSPGGVPTGSVDFYDATTATDLGQANLDPSGTATLHSSIPLEAGAQTIVLTFTSSPADFAASSATIGVSPLASVYVLNPTATAALSLSGSSTVTVPGTIQVASSSSKALVLSGNSRLTASTIGVFGGTSVSGSSAFGVSPTKDATAPADPLANLPIPSAAGLTTRAAVNLGGNSSLTIAPGIYPSISVGGSARLTLQPGIYVIAGGGFSVSGSGSVSGTGVLIYNAGSNYSGGPGNAFGSLAISGSGTLNLTAPTTGPYAGIVVFQSRDNTRAISLSGGALAGLNGGTVYAPAAMLSLSGSTQIGGSGSISSLVVGTLSLTGASGAFQLTAGSSSDSAVSVFNWITSPVLTVTAVDDTGQGLDPNELADLGDAMTYLNQALASFGVNLSWAAAGTSADVTVHFASTTPQGGVAEGVLGYTTAQNDVYIVTGWNYSTSADPSQIAPGQFDFPTLAIHELGHTLGLGESQDPNSVMYEFLSPGTSRRTLTDSNLSLIDTSADRYMKVSTGLPAATGNPVSRTDPSTVLHLGLDLSAIDAALAALGAKPDAASPLAASSVRNLDAAIESAFPEAYLIPLGVAQDVADANVAPPKTRKPQSIFGNP
jgi:hypothetical protein